MTDCPATPPNLPTSPTPPPTSSKTQEEEEKRTRSSSPEPNCSICLGSYDDVSYAEPCLHKFCFKCIVDWSKIRAVCPLCKADFKTVIHSIKSDDDFQRYQVPRLEPRVEIPSLDFGGVFQEIEINWATALENLRTRNRQRTINRANIQRSNIRRAMRNIPSGNRPNTRSRIYRENLYVNPDSLTDSTMSFRTCSPQWYRNNRAQTHRLVPWLNRELQAILTNDYQRLPYIIELILDLVQRYEIMSPEFGDRLTVYLGANTEHFQHEFFNFARSVYDLLGYDNNAEYLPHRPNQPNTNSQTNQSVLEISDSDSDIEIIGEVARSRPVESNPPVLLISSDSESSSSPSSTSSSSNSSSSSKSSSNSTSSQTSSSLSVKSSVSSKEKKSESKKRKLVKFSSHYNSSSDEEEIQIKINVKKQKLGSKSRQSIDSTPQQSTSSSYQGKGKGKGKGRSNWKHKEPSRRNSNQSVLHNTISLSTSDEEEDEANNLVTKTSKKSRAVMDQNVHDEYNIQNISKKDLRLKILNNRSNN